MKTLSRIIPIGIVLASLCGGPAVHAQAPAAAPPTPAAAPAPGAVRASLVFDEAAHEVDLVSREKDVVFYRPRGGPAGASTTLKLSGIVSADFELVYDQDLLLRSLRDENWPQAATLLLPVITPVLPYLDLNDNNGVDVAMDAGRALMRSARNLVQAGGTTNLMRSTNVYLRAHQVYKAVTRATWSPEAASARLQAVRCLCALNDLKGAAKEFELIDEPEVGDAVFGLYWLARAQLRYAQGQTREAMDAAVQSLVFDNKSVETFPDALFLSARCYEDLLEWYRARDVYYEIAKLFPHTEFGDTAHAKLKLIMEKGLTKAKETSPIEAVFFGLDEDVNVRAEALLNGTEPKVAETTEADIDRDVTDEVSASATNKQTSAEEGEMPK